jgi:macrolide-specific efflux system membrane fusion protein
MVKNKYVIVISITVVSLLLLLLIFRVRTDPNSQFILREIRPVVGDIRLSVMTTGVVEPQNRLEVKPSVNGRIEELLVREGAKVKKGQILARMSSTERAALVDAARSEGTETLRYWEEVYKQIPITSPIDGEVILRPVEPGQTVSTTDTILVLSDRLIVSAQFDETDIGRISVGQEAMIALDAYPDAKVKGVVVHVAYESELVNNVTIYNVEILPEEVPSFFRSGMSANVEVVEKERKNILLIPVTAVTKDQGRVYVNIRKKPGDTVEEREVEIGLSDEANAEVTSGLTREDVVVVKVRNYSSQKKSSGTNPFLPFGRGKKR